MSSSVPDSASPPLPAIPTGRLRWRFANAELDEGNLQLRVGSAPRTLEPKPLELLMFLLRQQGELATKDQLLAALWPGRIVTEASLTKCVAKLRQALDDDAQTLVRTVHGYGYRLGVAATAELIAAPSAPLAAATVPEGEHRHERRLMVIMFTDMVGYTALVQRNESLARELLEFQRKLVRQTLPQFAGNEIEVIGDAFLVEFASALRAVECAIAIQQRLAEHGRAQPQEQRVELRIGLHLGDIERLGKGVFGDSVNIASRIQSLAPEGGLAVSAPVHDQIHNKLAAPLKALGSTTLKGVTRPMELFVLEREALLQLPRPQAGRPASPRTGLRPAPALAAAVLLMLALAAVWLTRGPPSPSVDGPAAIAVLPFSNLSADAQNLYFVDGVHESILTQLARVQDLKVISRTSVMRYRHGEHDLKAIARELGVAYIVEGSVQREGQRVRVTAQLIEAGGDHHLWAETYDRDLADLFAIQSEVAQKIVAAVHAALTPREQARLQRAMTRSPEAYDLFLRAMAIRRDELPTQEHLFRIEALLEKAIALDPDFALAHAWLSDNHGSIWWFGFDSPAQRSELARLAAERAQRLDPDLAEVHLAWAGYYYGQREYARAIAETGIAIGLQPSFAGAYELQAAVMRRQGDWSRALATYKRALELDPHNPQIIRQTAETLEGLRRYPEGDRLYERYLAASPDAFVMASLRAILRKKWTGDLGFVKRTLEAIPAGADPNFLITRERVWLAQAEGRLDDAIRILQACPCPWLPSWGGGYRSPKELHLADLYRLTGSEESARANYQRARELLEQEIAVRPDDARAHEYLALALAGLNERPKAMEMIAKAVEMMPTSRDAILGPEILETRARIYLMLGEPERALDDLAALQKGPNNLSAQVWAREPFWASLHQQPRFLQLLSPLVR